jgi:hypothetical protein
MMKLVFSCFFLLGSLDAFVPTTISTRITQHTDVQQSRFIALYDKKTVFIDGEAGTTGIQVRDRLGKRDDIEVLSIPDELRKDEATRKKYINQADAVILCKLLSCLGGGGGFYVASSLKSC